MEQAGISVKLEADVKDQIAGFKSVQKELANTAASYKNLAASGNSVQSSLSKTAGAAKQAGFTLQGFSRVAQDAPFGLIGIGNNIPQVLDGFSALRKEAGSAGGALKALGKSLIGPAGVTLALSAGISILTSLTMKYGSFGAAMQAIFGNITALQSAQNDLNKSFAEAVGSAEAERFALNALFDIAKDETRSKQARQEAIDKINKDYPGYITNLKLETVNTEAVRKEVDKLNESLLRQAKIKAAQGLLEKEYQKILELTTDKTQDNTTFFDKVGVALRGAFSQSNGVIFGVNKNVERTGKLLDTAQKRAAVFEETLKQLLGEEADAGTLVVKPPKKENIKKVKKELNEVAFVETALVARVPDVNEFSAALAELRAKIAEETKRIPIPLQTKLTAATGSRFIDPAIMARAKELADIQDGIAERNARLVASFQQVLQPAVQEFFQTIITSGGSAIDQLGQTIKRLVTQLVSAVAAAAALAAIVSAITGTPFNTNFKVFLGSGGIPKFANGGVVSGPTLAMVGEYPGARTNPEVIAPLDKLEAMIGAGGGGNLQAVVRGSDLLFILNRATRSQGRQG